MLINEYINFILTDGCVSRPRAFWDAVLKRIVYLFSSFGFQRVCSFEYVYTPADLVSRPPLLVSDSEWVEEITFTWLKKAAFLRGRGAETEVTRFSCKSYECLRPESANWDSRTEQGDGN